MSASTAGLVMYAGMRSLPVPGDPVTTRRSRSGVSITCRRSGWPRSWTACASGLVAADGRFTDAGRETKQRIEALTDELAAPPYDALAPAELAELEPITAALVAAGPR
jgi:hypothetical protein